MSNAMLCSAQHVSRPLFGQKIQIADAVIVPGAPSVVSFMSFKVV